MEKVVSWCHGFQCILAENLAFDREIFDESLLIHINYDSNWTKNKRLKCLGCTLTIENLCEFAIKVKGFLVHFDGWSQQYISLLLIQEEQLSVNGERMCAKFLVIGLGEACPGTVWIG